jgi:adenylate cyclase
MWKRIAHFVFGEPVGGQLPRRIRRAIAVEEARAEILIGWVQLALVSFFFALYSIAPKTSAGTPFMPVPFVLSGYLAFSLIRLALAYAWRLPRWFVLVSIVIDIGLLMLLIWSFHLQYQQAAPFYLKAPTLLYVFIFIALRALRFAPTYVLAAGLTAALGWGVLVSHATRDMSVVTRNYVEYLTSNRVLVGAEIDKIISILLVTLVLSVALIRARRLLMRAVADATVARDLTRFIAPEIASHIKSAESAIQPGDGEVKAASVLFCDIEGFSAISERLGPDVLMRTLNDYLAVVASVVSAHDGVITQFQGDALLVTFNAATPVADHATRALQTALAIQQVVARERFGPGLRLRTRCGVSSGELVAGAVGTPERMLITVHGDEVNIAARLDQLNKSYGTYVLATAGAVAAAGDGFACRPMGALAVRGRAAPVEVFEVTGQSQTGADGEAGSGRAPSTHP